jgi:hypothetical protein
MRKGKLACAAALLVLCGWTGLSAQENVRWLHSDLLPISHVNDTTVSYVVKTNQIYEAGMDTLPQIVFWRTVMNLPPDSGLISMQGERRIFATWSTTEWDRLGEAKQLAYRDSIRVAHHISDSVKIFFTAGKSDFYNASGVIADIHKGVPIFIQENVDPFYAQAILLIESPGKVRKSNAGAVGSFQLMSGVARNMGLKVNKNIDERRDFEKSAWAAAKLIRTTCVPQVNAMLLDHGIQPDSTTLWYRLLVLHTYHAGSGNVAAALNVIQPKTGGIWLIQRLWVTKAASFGNASQNYSQLAVSAMIEMDEALRNDNMVKLPPEAKDRN